MLIVYFDVWIKQLHTIMALNLNEPLYKWVYDLLEGTGHYWLSIKIIVNVKTHLVTSNEDLLKILNIVRNGFFWKRRVLERGNSHSKLKRLQACKSTQIICAPMFCFSFHYSLVTLMTNWVLISTNFVFHAQYVGIHLVRILVFDNYF